MWLPSGLFILPLLLTVDALSNCSPKSCKLGLDVRKPACGSDGFTYYNRCHLELARCNNSNITFLHRGVCKRKQNCKDYIRSNPNFKFKPQCRKDGNFAAAQCHSDIGYCWCVDQIGHPIPYSTMRYKPGVKHRCGQGKHKTTRSSSKNRKPGKACKREDKALFNTNLIQIFTNDWRRDNGYSRSLINDTLVLDWKFQLMDLDHNDHLDKTEYRDLRKLVKKVVKPKRCAKSFAKACDMNRDQVIGRQEWAQCLTRDGLDDVKGSSDGNNPEDEEEEEDDRDDLLTSYGPSSILTDGSSAIHSSPNFDDDSSERKGDEDATDCLSDRRTALDEDYHLYVPECTLDGRYAKVQCYKSAGYCWCVNEDTGKNIAGTAVKDKMPKCDHIASARPMKGCPEEKKTVFLKELMEYLHTRMVRETNGTSITGIGSSTWRSTKEEQIASWSFIFFDKNKNKLLDKVEWKSFKDTMASVKKLRRCGKKLPRYCDINKDRLISMTEWLDCLNTQRFQEQSTIPSSMKSAKNPLSLLMED